MSAPFVRFFPIGLVLFTIVLAASLTDGAPRQHKCPVEECSQQFANSKALMYHYFGTHPEHAATGTMYDNRYKCLIVGCPQGSAVFHESSQLKKHCRTEHQYELKNERRKYCHYCPNGAEGRLYWSFQLRDHVKTEHPDQSWFICEGVGCGQVFFRKSELTKHQMSCDEPQHTLLTLESGEQSGRPGLLPPSASSNPIEPTTESTTEPIGTSFGTGPQYTDRPDLSQLWCNRHVSGPGFQLWSNRHVSGPGFADAAPDQEGMLPDPSSSPAVDRHTGPWRTP